MGALIRLDKLLSNMGNGSRKEVALLLKAGRVLVDGAVETRGERKVDPESAAVMLDGKPVAYRRYTTLMMNKPAGVVSSTDEPGEKTVIDLLDPPYNQMGLFPAGRLDKDTVGLLLLTNDGQFAHEMLAPKKHVDKTYYVEVLGEIGERERELFAAGLTLRGGVKLKPARLTILEAGERSRAELIITEGKFHQVKRMFETTGQKVVFLKRVRMGGLCLDKSLAPGEVRMLDEWEKRVVFSAK